MRSIIRVVHADTLLSWFNLVGTTRVDYTMPQVASTLLGQEASGAVLRQQAAPAAKTVSATLTAGEILGGLLTVNQGAGAASQLQLPLASALDAALPHAVADDSFDFSLINVSTTDADDASITTNTGWTLNGDMTVPARSAAGSLNCSGLFRARKTGAAAWSLYRIA